MKRFFYLLLLAAVITACGGPEGTKVDSTEAVEETAGTIPAAQYNVDPAASIINWEGAKIAYSHTGTMPISEGKMMVADGKIVGGMFTINVAGMKNTDIEDPEKAAKLEGHLKSADFFDTEKFPIATFNITSVSPAAEGADHTHNVSGNLTIKDKSRNIMIPATVEMEGDMVKATTPAFVIDRYQWGVEYGSGNLVDIAKDDIINDEVGLTLTLVANKQ
jgi:polyisoprenoid-binding protein YceI